MDSILIIVSKCSGRDINMETTVIIQVEMKVDWTKAVLEIERRQWIERESGRKNQPNLCCSEYRR